MKKLWLILLMLLTGCTQAQPVLREAKEVQTSIPYSDEELIENANQQLENKGYSVDSVTMQSDTEVWFSIKNEENKQYVFKYKDNELVPDRLVDNVD